VPDPAAAGSLGASDNVSAVANAAALQGERAKRQPTDSTSDTITPNAIRGSEALRYVARVPQPRYSVSSDPHINKILGGLTRGERSAYMRAAVIEKHARDQQRGEIDELRREVAELRELVERLVGTPAS
jgi:hypothetical protein